MIDEIFYEHILYRIVIFVGVYALFAIFKLDDTPVPISDAMHMILIYYFAISVYNALPTIKYNCNKKRQPIKRVLNGIYIFLHEFRNHLSTLSVYVSMNGAGKLRYL